MKSKGKAAVDVIGGRFGKAGGGVIQSTVFLLLPSYTFNEATPFFAIVFFVTMIAWVYAVLALGVEYSAKLGEKDNLKEVLVDKSKNTNTANPLPTASGFPKYTDNTKCLVKKYLTPEMYKKMADKKTNKGFTLD